VAAEFSVRLLSGEVQVFVTRGTAHLRCFDAATSTPPAILHAETVARVGSRLIVYQPSQAESERLSSWRRGLLIFHATALADAVAEFNRYCLHNLVIVDPSIAQIRIGGQFRYTNVDAFLALLQQGFPIVAEQSGNQLILRRRT
jgi:transmembrane sensor